MSTVQLLAVVEVSRDSRVRCQAIGCDHPVFRRIHVVRENGKIHVYGSECFKRLFASLPQISSTPRYTSTDGRHLTEEERQLLIENTERLIQKFETVHQEELARIAVNSATGHASVLPVPPPVAPAQLQPPVSHGELREVEAQARKIVRAKYNVDPELPGWRGLVLEEVRRILDQNAG